MSTAGDASKAESATSCFKPAVEPACAGCRHRLDDRRMTEQRVAGLAVFGSAYGASIGGSRLCVLHDRWVSPNDFCGRFSPLG
ncbi:MAG: hypothetical protein WAM90_16895 [Rhodanobacter sp.]